MHQIRCAIFAVLFVGIVMARPPVKSAVDQHPDGKDDPNHKQPNNIPENTLMYEHYLREVVNLLESDPEFRKKLDSADSVDIRSGKIAHELEYVSHRVRSQLDELKRTEVARLRQYANQQFRLTNEIDVDHLKIPNHLDHENPDTFEISDLKKLILTTAEDLAAADQARRENFKEYELQKEFEKQQKLESLDEEKRKKFEESINQQEKKHRQHEKVHYPGNKPQLEEVWEKQDHMEGQEFDPKAFFMLHDVDGNGFWDEVEVKALFIKELDKVYQRGASEDDLREREEEMERMREQVFKNADTNRDKLISYQEFLDETKREEFNRDPNWDTVDETPQFTQDEYLHYEKQRQAEIDRMVAEGRLPQQPSHHGYYDQQGYYNQPPPPYQQPPHQQPPYHQPPHHQPPHQQPMHQQPPYQQPPGQYHYQHGQHEQPHYQDQAHHQQQQQHHDQQQHYPNQQQYPNQPNSQHPILQNNAQTVNAAEPVKVPVSQNAQPQQQQQQVPVQQQQVPVQQQQVPAQQQQVPVQQQQVPAQQQQVPVQQQQVPPKQEQVPPKQEQVPSQQQPAPSQTQGSHPNAI